jgi:hypothetical protein
MSAVKCASKPTLATSFAARLGAAILPKVVRLGVHA